MARACGAECVSAAPTNAKRRWESAEIHLQHPDRAETQKAQIMGSEEGAPRELLEIFYGARTRRADLRGECYSDLVWDGQRPPALYGHERDGGYSHRLVSKVD